MKNVQVIDGADNCTFSVFQATESEFEMIFSTPHQDIEFAEDLFERLGQDSRALEGLWSRPVKKRDVVGIHGTLFFGFSGKRRYFPASKREKDWDPRYLNEAQRKLWSS